MISRHIHTIIVAVMTLLTMAACQKEGFRIEGAISEAADSVLYLEHMALSGVETTDSVKLSADGSFSFKGERADAPDFYRLRIAGSIINVCVDSTETVTVKAKYPTMATDYTVEGSPNNEKIKELALLQIQLTKQVMAIERLNTIGVRETQDSIQAVVERYKDYVSANYIFSNPQTPYAYFALFQTLGQNLIFNPRENKKDVRCFAAVATSWDTYHPGAERGENLHNIAVEGLKTIRLKEAREQGPSIADQVEVTTLIDVPLPDNQGRTRSLKELNGRVVMLDFHAFSAPGSTDRIMQLRELYNKYHAQGLEIYQVGLDPDEHFWKTQTAALPWICVYDEAGARSQYLSRYNVQQIPTFFLIDRSNTLYKRDSQINDIDDEIRLLLK